MATEREHGRNGDNPAVAPGQEAVAREEWLREVEKILAGQPDVNLPALLTRDVQGG